MNHIVETALISSCFLVTLDPQKDGGHRNRASPEYFQRYSKYDDFELKSHISGFRAISEAKIKIAENRTYGSMHNF